MAGRWRVKTTAQGISIDYSDWTTHRDWQCSAKPVAVPREEAMAFVMGEVRPGDLVEIDGLVLSVGAEAEA